MTDCGDVQKVFVATQPTEPIPQIKGIEISDVASEKIKLFLKQDKKSPDAFALRIDVTKDGCSGLSYKMDLVDISTCEADKDKHFEKHGAHVMIKRGSYFYVTGSRLDYVEALTGSGFQLVNPNITKSCSCGSSFNVT